MFYRSIGNLYKILSVLLAPASELRYYIDSTWFLMFDFYEEHCMLVGIVC